MDMKVIDAQLGKPVKDMSFPEKLGRTFEILRDEDSTRGFARKVAVLMEKLAYQELTCAVIGQFKRGKSALVNRILGEDILPVGIIPITSAVTRVVREPGMDPGSDPGSGTDGSKARIIYRNGLVEEVPFSELSHYISEQEKKNNQLGIAEAVISTSSDFLKEGLTLVDTPGVGSFHKNNTETAYLHMKEADVVIFLLSVDSPINEIEIQFLRKTKDFAAKFFFAVNKSDLVPPEDLKEYVEYCEMVIGQIMESDGPSPEAGERGAGIRIFPVSAKTGMGVDVLKAAVLEELEKDRGSIAELSAKKKLADIIKASIGQLNFYWKAMNLPYKELDEKFGLIEEELENIRKDAEADASVENPAARLNDYKVMLSEKVEELFGMEYYFDIEHLDGETEMSREEFQKACADLTDEVKETLNYILMYREENAYKVLYRINGINRAIRELRRIRDALLC